MNTENSTGKLGQDGRFVEYPGLTGTQVQFIETMGQKTRFRYVESGFMAILPVSNFEEIARLNWLLYDVYPDYEKIFESSDFLFKTGEERRLVREELFDFREQPDVREIWVTGGKMKRVNRSSRTELGILIIGTEYEDFQSERIVNKGASFTVIYTNPEILGKNFKDESEQINQHIVRKIIENGVRFYLKKDE